MHTINIHVPNVLLIFTLPHKKYYWQDQPTTLLLQQYNNWAVGAFAECIVYYFTLCSWKINHSLTTTQNIHLRISKSWSKTILRLLQLLSKDVWHWARNFTKKLTEACRTKSQKELVPWLKQIKNHVWWSAQQCGGDAETLVEMVRSMMYHVVNVHTEFDGHTLYQRCAHSALDE